MNDEEKEEMRITKAVLFVEHIEEHLNEMGLSEESVMCKICNKTIDEIYKEK